jgi:hypothetical protein
MSALAGHRKALITVEQFLRMGAAGVFEPDARLELIVAAARCASTAT